MALYAGSRSRFAASEFMCDRHPQLPSERPDSSVELSVAYGAQAVTKLQHILRGTDLPEADLVLALNLLSRQLPAAADAIVRTGTLLTCLAFLSSPSADVRYEAARIAAGCAEVGVGVATLLETDAITTLFIHLAQDERKTRAVLVRAAVHLANDSAVQASLCSAGGAACLGALLASIIPTPAGVEAVATLAASTCAEALLALGAAPIVTQCLHAALERDDEASAFFCLSTLRSLSGGGEAAKAAVLAADPMAALMSCIDAPSTSRMRGAGVGAVALLVLLLSGTKAAIAPHVSGVSRLVKLTYDGSRVIAATAKQAIRTLVASAEGRDAFIRALLMDDRTLVDVVGTRSAAPLVALLRPTHTASGVEKEAAAKCLLRLADYSDAGLEAVADAPGVVVILQAVLADGGASGVLRAQAAALAHRLADGFADMHLAFRPDGQEPTPEAYGQ